MPKSEWISVKKRMPNEYQDVLVYPDFYVCHYCNTIDGKCWYDTNGVIMYTIAPTHWLPLPEPPEAANGKK